MAKILHENPILLGDVPKHVPGRPSLAAVYRWFRTGIRGVKLETMLVGGKRMTSEAALERFFVASTAVADGLIEEPAEDRSASIRSAERELERAGI